MLVCYVLFGAGFGKGFLKVFKFRLRSGTSPLLRSYIAQVTSEENRSTAYALQNGAMVLSVIVGPGECEPLCHIHIHFIAVAQISFAGLPYPGVIVIAPHIKLNIYTGGFASSTRLSNFFSAPIWFAVLTNIIAIAITAFLLEDAHNEIEKVNNGKPSRNYLSNVAKFR